MATKKCGACAKSVYYNDPQLPLGDKTYHKTCARCAVCNGYLSIKNYSTAGDRLLCKVHFKEEFSNAGGVYAGGEKFKRKCSRSMSPVPPCGGGGLVVAASSSMDASCPVTSDEKQRQRGRSRSPLPGAVLEDAPVVAAAAAETTQES